MTRTPVLSVDRLNVSYPDSKRPVLNDVSLQIQASEIVGLVGESGSGKTQLALSIIRLLNEEAQVKAQSLKLGGIELLALSEEDMCSVRGQKVSMVFQEPMTALNPVFTIGYQLSEALSCHKAYEAQDLKNKALELLNLVKIDSPDKRFDQYPHQISGGMRQRVLIAMALAVEPYLLIADEPTTALDVTTGAQVLDLLRSLQKTLGISVLFVTHDLGIVAELCDYVYVMYGGQIVEKGSVKEIFTNPTHPYTQLLLDSVPKIGHKMKDISFDEKDESSFLHLKEACLFYERCEKRKKDPCSTRAPELKKIKSGHHSACFFAKMKGE